MLAWRLPMVSFATSRLSAPTVSNLTVPSLDDATSWSRRLIPPGGRSSDPVRRCRHLLSSSSSVAVSSRRSRFVLVIMASPALAGPDSFPSSVAAATTSHASLPGASTPAPGPDAEAAAPVPFIPSLPRRLDLVQQPPSVISLLTVRGAGSDCMSEAIGEGPLRVWQDALDEGLSSSGGGTSICNPSGLLPLKCSGTEACI
mmetsp:Transcript_15760/g.47822  ORF Transcript_15760/g.47822 Transcript_15760/m.47822 type:complete len:201 (+) Transcript_15760:2126-2728(+)